MEARGCAIGGGFWTALTTVLSCTGLLSALCSLLLVSPLVLRTPYFTLLLPYSPYLSSYTSSCSHARGNEALATPCNAGRSVLPPSLRLRSPWLFYYAKGNHMQRSCRSKSKRTSMPALRDSSSHTPDQLCDRSFGNVTFVGAHDSYAVGTKSRTFFAVA